MRQFRGKVDLNNGQRGSTTVEMAIFLPLFLLLVFGIFEFSRAWFTLNSMNHATREAVRLAAVTPALTAGHASVIARATNILTASGITTATVANTAPTGSPKEVQVTIDLTYSWITQIGPLLGYSFKGTIPLHTSAIMRYELT